VYKEDGPRYLEDRGISLWTRIYYVEGKEIIVGVTGGIAVYKTVELVRELTRKVQMSMW
jgi:hypothetical protein